MKGRVLIFVVVGCISGVALFSQYQRGIGERRARVGLEANAIASAMSMYYAKYRRIPGGHLTSEDKWEVSSRDVYEDFKSNAPSMLYQPARWQSAGNLVDEWNRSYHFRVVPAETQSPDLLLIVWSFGPNGIDEGGMKDDIAHTVEIE